MVQLVHVEATGALLASTLLVHVVTVMVIRRLLRLLSSCNRVQIQVDVTARAGAATRQRVHGGGRCGVRMRRVCRGVCERDRVLLSHRVLLERLQLLSHLSRAAYHALVVVVVVVLVQAS